jgi:hypothetical protein
MTVTMPGLEDLDLPGAGLHGVVDRVGAGRGASGLAIGHSVQRLEARY